MQFDTPNYLGTAVSAFEAGRTHGRDIRRQNALAQYAGGDKTGGVNALMVEDPALASQFQQRDQQQAEQERRRQIGAQAAGGDLTGARTAALSAGDFDTAGAIAKMSEDQKALALQHAEQQAGVYASLKTYPVEMRKQAIASIKPQLVAAGMDPAQIDAFDPSDANIDALMGQTLGLKDTLAQQLAERKTAAAESRANIFEDANGNSYRLDPETNIVTPLTTAAKQYAPRAPRAAPKSAPGSSPALDAIAAELRRRGKL
jgi:hypothetical protein